MPNEHDGSQNGKVEMFDVRNDLIYVLSSFSEIEN